MRGASSRLRACRLESAEASVDQGMFFEDLSAVQSYLDALTASAWWEARFPSVARIEAAPIKSTTVAAVGMREAWRRAGVVGVTRRGMTETTLLHEAAHAVCGVGAGHGRQWARTYLELVFRKMGERAWRELRAAFLSAEVGF